MKAKVTAKVVNSPIMPVKEFIAEHVIEFDENDNVFGRTLKFRQEFRKYYGQNITLDIQKVEWLKENRT